MTNPLMVDPEISRRCRSCGASIRAGGFFCPQCGKATSQPAADQATAVETEEVFMAPETVSVDLSGVPTADLTSDKSRSAETVPLQPFTHDVEPSAEWQQERPTVRFPAATNHHPVPGIQPDEVRTRLRSEAFGGEVKKGLGKVREISTVMIDEASYDPSARFVLVAAILFVLFLVILILSEMMR
jgi:hypothetical protein